MFNDKLHKICMLKASVVHTGADFKCFFFRCVLVFTKEEDLLEYVVKEIQKSDNKPGKRVLATFAFCSALEAQGIRIWRANLMDKICCALSLHDVDDEERDAITKEARSQDDKRKRLV